MRGVPIPSWNATLSRLQQYCESFFHRLVIGTTRYIDPKRAITRAGRQNPLFPSASLPILTQSLIFHISRSFGNTSISSLWRIFLSSFHSSKCFVQIFFSVILYGLATKSSAHLHPVNPFYLQYIYYLIYCIYFWGYPPIPAFWRDDNFLELEQLLELFLYPLEICIIESGETTLESIRTHHTDLIEECPAFFSMDIDILEPCSCLFFGCERYHDR